MLVPPLHGRVECPGGHAETVAQVGDRAGLLSAERLVAAGTLAETQAPRDAAFPQLDPGLPGKPLAPDQADAADTLRAAIRAGGYGTTLLRGVTGSGKTEVYLEAVAETLRQGRQALVLLPEIALSAEFLDRVEARFGARPGEWHSGVTGAERRRLGVQEGDVAALTPSSVEFIEKASGIQRRFVLDKAGILDPARMTPDLPERGNDELSILAEMAVKAARDALAAWGTLRTMD